MPRTAMGAHTLPGKYFTSREVYDQETERIFSKSWICAGRASSIPNPGDFFLHDLDGESLIIIRAESGQINCLYNVCRHRGTRLQKKTMWSGQKQIALPLSRMGLRYRWQSEVGPQHDGDNRFL